MHTGTGRELLNFKGINLVHYWGTTPAPYGAAGVSLPTLPPNQFDEFSSFIIGFNLPRTEWFFSSLHRFEYQVSVQENLLRLLTFHSRTHQPHSNSRMKIMVQEYKSRISISQYLWRDSQKKLKIVLSMKNPTLLRFTYPLGFIPFWKPLENCKKF